MDETYCFTHRGYDLHCAPVPQANGRFGARVIVRRDDPREVQRREFPDLPEFDTAYVAVGHARLVGEFIVDELQDGPIY